MPTKHFEIGGHAVHVHHAGRTTLPEVPPDLGRGRTLVFLHGAGSTGAAFRRQLEHFAAHHSPLALDYPGHGRSSGTEALGSVREYADVVHALLDRLGVRRAVLVGASMGGVVALELALAAPDRIAGLVLVSTSGRFEIPASTLDTWRNVMNGRTPQPFTPEGYGDDVPFEVMREGWELQVRTDPRVRYFDFVALDGVDLRNRLGAVAAPTLVVHGTKDTIVPPAAGEALAKKIPGARYVAIEGGGHYLYRERPDALHAAIDDFLGGLAS